VKKSKNILIILLLASWAFVPNSYSQGAGANVKKKCKTDQTAMTTAAATAAVTCSICATVWGFASCATCGLSVAGGVMANQQQRQCQGVLGDIDMGGPLDEPLTDLGDIPQDILDALNEACPGEAIETCIKNELKKARAAIANRGLVSASGEKDIINDPNTDAILAGIDNLTNGTSISDANFSTLSSFSGDTETDLTLAEVEEAGEEGEESFEDEGVAGGRALASKGKGKKDGKDKKGSLFANFFGKKKPNQKVKFQNGLEAYDPNSRRALTLFDRAERRYLGLTNEIDLRRGVKLARAEFLRQKEINRVIATFRKAFGKKAKSKDTQKVPANR